MSDLSSAIKHICEEKNLSYDAVIKTIESALSAAYRKDFGQKNQNIQVEFNEKDVLKSKIYDVKTVVEDLPQDDATKKADKEDEKAGGKNNEEGDNEEKEEKKFNPKLEIQLSDALLLKPDVKVGDELKIELEMPSAYGRMAAQTAKQVIIQRLREAEREMVYNDFKDKEGEVVGGLVQRVEGRLVLVDLGKAVGIIPPEEQIAGEKYRPGERIKVYVKSVSLKPKGPEIILSRTSEEIVKKVFYLEIPEISNGLIELKNVAREAGYRSKVSVYTDSENVDPIGSCVGQRGSRIQTIINELGGEKIDIIEYSDDPVQYISNALSPAKIINIDIDEGAKKATVLVAPDQFSLAIGKGGQNARLAAKLTDWKIDIKQSEEESDSEKESAKNENDEEMNKSTDKEDADVKDLNGDDEAKSKEKSEKDDKKDADKKEIEKSKENESEKEDSNEEN